MPAAVTFQSRVKGLEYVRASKLVAHPKNWRVHTPAQREMLRGVLQEIGFAGAVIGRLLPDGRIEVIDGHLRQQEAGDHDVPVLVTDLNDEEAALFLASYDSLGMMAETDKKALADLLRSFEAQTDGLQSLLQQLATQNRLNIDLFSDEAKQLLSEPSQRVGLAAAGEQNPPPPPLSGVRMVQLFLNEKTVEEFHAMIAVLGAKYETSNPTDTVMECLRCAYREARQPA